MLASITPLGERGRQSTWGITVGAFLFGGARCRRAGRCGARHRRLGGALGDQPGGQVGDPGRRRAGRTRAGRAAAEGAGAQTAGRRAVAHAVPGWVWGWRLWRPTRPRRQHRRPERGHLRRAVRRIARGRRRLGALSSSVCSAWRAGYSPWPRGRSAGPTRWSASTLGSGDGGGAVHAAGCALLAGIVVVALAGIVP